MLNSSPTYQIWNSNNFDEEKYFYVNVTQTDITNFEQKILINYKTASDNYIKGQSFC